MQIMVYHAPKTKELQLNGMEGTVKSIVKKYKGKETSANLPYRIEFLLEKDDGKQQKFFAHVVSTRQNKETTVYWEDNFEECMILCVL